jgi:hypothetical protein
MRWNKALGVFYLPTETRVNVRELRRKRLDVLRESKQAIAASGRKSLHSGMAPRRQSNCRRMTITDWLNFAMLLCAAIGSMAFGILAAYAILRAGFWFIRPHPRPAPVKAPQPEAARTL